MMNSTYFRIKCTMKVTSNASVLCNVQMSHDVISAGCHLNAHFISVKYPADYRFVTLPSRRKLH
jgi:hypothetical protein